jgi:site-specific DNA-cytosine methylase
MDDSQETSINRHTDLRQSTVLRVLVACEWSGKVRDRAIDKGHEAWSIDLDNPAGKHRIFGCQDDVLKYLDYGWDVMIAFPPCNYLTKANGHHGGDNPYRERALAFIRTLMDAPIPRICIENPVGVISSKIRQPDQIVHPFMFGEPYKKATCLWLKGLPQLVPTQWVHPGDVQPWVNGYRDPKLRGMTFDGIAQAMADQWL